MSDEIGKIEKPSSKDIIGKRKAFICVLLQAPPEASKDLHELIQKYWEALDANITNLESKAGIVKRIFVEGIPGKGEDVSISLKEASLGAWNVLQQRISSGAEFEEFENLEILQKVIDWSKCLNVGLSNRSVAEKISEEFNSTIIDYTKKNKDRTIKKLTNIIEKHDETYSPLSLYFIIDNNLIDEMTEINRLFDELINHVKLEEEIKNLIIYKKALYNSDKSDEFFLLNVLKPLINSDSIWKAHGLNLMGEFFYDKNEKEKSKEFFQQILQLDKINSDIKKNSQIRLQRDLGEK